jgi:hypothetical protein
VTRRWLFSLALSTATSLAAANAWAIEPEECVSLHASGQDARENGKLTSARTSFLQCAAEECPTVVREECARLLGSVETSLPTLVFDAKDAKGNSTKNVEISVDGNVIADKLRATAIGIDPGEHRFQFKGPGGKVVTQNITVLEGQKNRLIEISFADDESKKPAAPVAEQPKQQSSIPTGAYVLGGVSVVALGAFGYFALSGRSKQSDLEDGCAPNCPESDYDDMKQKYLFADIALGVAVISGGLATWLVIGSGKSESRVGAGLLPGGGAARWETRF